MGKTAWIVGAGLAGATLSHQLRARGAEVERVFEEGPSFGGLSRSAVSPHGVVYEPNGSHIFHTNHRDVWELVTNLVPFNGYRHSVVTMIRGQKMTWPIQEHEVRARYGDRIADAMLANQHRARNPALPDGLPSTQGEDFESWCLRIMPREVYEDFVKPYTEKHWGVDASELDSSFAPARVQVRSDGDKGLFKDQYQGFPDAREEGGTYDALHWALWGPDVSKIELDRPASLMSVYGLMSTYVPPDLLYVTVPLDVFCGAPFGALPWRGLSFEHRFVSDEDAAFIGGYAQDAMVVNWPAKSCEFIRTHETKHASGQAIGATVLTKEYTGAPTRFYPVPGRGGTNRALNERYREFVEWSFKEFPTRVRFIGRLSTYQYLDMDDVIKSAIEQTGADC